MKILFAAAIAASALVVSAPGFADSANWDAEKERQILINRGSDAGQGNGAEFLVRKRVCENGGCRVELVVVSDPDGDEDRRRDLDPGNAGGN